MQFRCSLFDDTLVDREVDRWTKVDRETGRPLAWQLEIWRPFRPSDVLLRALQATHADNIQNISENSKVFRRKEIQFFCDRHTIGEQELWSLVVGFRS